MLKLMGQRILISSKLTLSSEVPVIMTTYLGSMH